MALQAKHLKRYTLSIIRLIRVYNLFVIILTQYFTRLFLINHDTGFKQILLNTNLFLISLSTVCIAAGGYIINDYYDVKIDAMNRPGKIIIDRFIKRQYALAMQFTINVIGLGLAYLVSREIFVFNTICSFLLWIYSNSLKRIPLVGNIVISLLTAATLIVLTLHFPGNHSLVYTFAIFAFFISLIREIIKDMEDLKGDIRFGCQTLPIMAGIRSTKNIILIILLLFTGTLVYMGTVHLERINFFYFIFVLVICLGYFLYRLKNADKVSDYYFLSRFSKAIMILGILSMAII